MRVPRTPVTRRRLLSAAGIGAALTVAGVAAPATRAAARVAATVNFPDYPFPLGVASGDPLPHGVVLWTRLAPQPLAEDGNGGMPPEHFQVQWEVAEDERFQRVTQRGETNATPKWAHSAHIEVDGLEPAREYFYRFRVGNEISPVGRTRTAPAKTASPRELTFGIASCQQFAGGYYPAYRDMVQSDLDVVLFLGDYIYEGYTKGTLGRAHLPAREVQTLAEYRVRHAQHKTDPLLREVHAAIPWVVTLDDHDVDNNWAGALPGNDNPEGFLDRRAAAFQAFYEHLPMRRSSLPRHADMQLYRRVGYGDLVKFHMLDTRQYRGNQPLCADPERVDGYCPGALSPELTILGAEQQQWLEDGLKNSQARWNMIAHQTRFTPYDLAEGPEKHYGLALDTWGDGYVAERNELLDAFGRTGVSNPAVLGGDAHRHWLFDLKRDFADPDSETVSTEMMCSSISSNGDRVDVPTRFGGTPDNPYELFLNCQRGYVRCHLDRSEWRMDFRVSDTVLTPDAPLYTSATFVVEDGKPGAQRV